MPALTSDSKILVTGGAGFLGHHLMTVLQSQFSAVSFDVKKAEGRPDSIVGSVTDPAAIDAAMEGVSGLVIGHMAPRAPGVYDSPELPFDINVKGVALLLEAAVKHGIRRIVLISSVGVVSGAQKSKTFLSQNLPTSPDNLYALTKALGEDIAQYYHSKHGLEIAMLRPAYICPGDTLVDKYGVKRPSVNWQFIDPRDIGKAAAAALTVEELGCEPFHLVAGPGAEERADIQRTMDRLGWQPDYRFTEFPHD